MKSQQIIDGNVVLAIIIRASDWETGLHFACSDEDYVQVGTWGYDKGHKLAAHIHLNAPRQVQYTQEVLFVKEGHIRADIYSTKEEFLKSVELGIGDTLILLRGGHGYEILDGNTQVLEIKNGPYLGAEVDRKRI